MDKYKFDDQPVELVNIHDPELCYNWAKSVSSNCNTISIPVDMPYGDHTIRIWHADPGIVLEKIVLRKEGIEDPTYLGPPFTVGH